MVEAAVRSGDSVPRDPAVPLRRPRDLLRARGGDARPPAASSSSTAASCSTATRASGKSSLVNAGLLPAASTSWASIPSACACSRAPARSSWSSGSHRRRRRRAFLPSLLAPDGDARRGSCSRREAFEERVRAACAVAPAADRLRPVRGDRDAVRGGRRRDAAAAHRRAARRAPARRRCRSSCSSPSARTTSAGSSSCSPPCPELVDQALRLSAARGRRRCRRSSAGRSSAIPATSRASSRPSWPSACATTLAERFGSGEVSLSEVQTVCLRLWQSDDPEALLAAKGVQGLLEDYLGEALDAFPPELRYRRRRAARPDGHLGGHAQRDLGRET